MNKEEMKSLFAEWLVKKVDEYTSQLRKCPFCGCEIGITICDDEGNDKRLDYLGYPYSGIAFKLNHDNGGCILCDFNEISPIYSVEDDDFDKALDQLVSDWNGGAK